MVEGKRVAVVVPAFEEEHLVAETLRGIPDFVDTIVVVDDKSPDGTAEKAEALASEIGGIHVLRRPRKMGLGSAYREAFAAGADPATILRPHVAAARAALDLGLGVNAGHDLNLLNLGAYAAAVPGLQEVSLGHAFTVDALRLGIAATVRAYQRCLGKTA